MRQVRVWLSSVLEYAGAGANYKNGDIMITYSAPILRNCIIRNSAGSGIYLSSSGNWPVILDSEISTNKWGVYSTGSNPVYHKHEDYREHTSGVTNLSTTD